MNQPLSSRTVIIHAAEMFLETKAWIKAREKKQERLQRSQGQWSIVLQGLLTTSLQTNQMSSWEKRSHVHPACGFSSPSSKLYPILKLDPQGSPYRNRATALSRLELPQLMAREPDDHLQWDEPNHPADGSEISVENEDLCLIRANNTHAQERSLFAGHLQTKMVKNPIMPSLLCTGFPVWTEARAPSLSCKTG